MQVNCAYLSFYCNTIQTCNQDHDTMPIAKSLLRDYKSEGGSSQILFYFKESEDCVGDWKKYWWKPICSGHQEQKNLRYTVLQKTETWQPALPKPWTFVKHQPHGMSCKCLMYKCWHHAASTYSFSLVSFRCLPSGLWLPTGVVVVACSCDNEDRSRLRKYFFSMTATTMLSKMTAPAIATAVLATNRMFVDSFSDCIWK